MAVVGYIPGIFPGITEVFFEPGTRLVEIQRLCTHLEILIQGTALEKLKDLQKQFSEIRESSHKFSYYIDSCLGGSCFP